MARAARLKQEWIPLIFNTWQQVNPHPETELEFGNTFQLIVAVVLSAQSTDKGVNKATKALFAKVKTPQQMIALGEAGLTEHIKTIGLYRNKAKNVIKLSEQLIADHGGEVPNDQAALENLAGVGRKTANVVRNCAFGEPTMAVDTHIYRVGRRLGFSTGKTPLAVEQDLLRHVPKDYLLHAHHWLILHGRYTCTARSPKCGQCRIAQWCSSSDKNVT